MNYEIFLNLKIKISGSLKKVGEMMDILLEHIMTNYRWVFVIFFLLPLSFLFEIFNYGRNWIVFNLSTAPRQHGKKVKEVQKQVSKTYYYFKFH